MVDFTQFFNPSAWGSWNQPSQSMVGPKPPMANVAAPGAAQPGTVAPGAGGPMTLPSAPAGPLGRLFGFDSMGMANLGGGKPIPSTPGQNGPQIPGSMSGNPMLAKFGAAMMQGQNPLQAMMQNPGDFAKWAAQRRAAMPAIPGNPMGPQPPAQQPGQYQLGGGAAPPANLPQGATNMTPMQPPMGPQPPPMYSPPQPGMSAMRQPGMLGGLY